MQKKLNSLMIVIISGVLLSAFGVQFIYREEPCPLCMLQRLGMIAVATAAAMNLKFGIKASHYAMMLIASLFGGFVALRQISLHVCPGFSAFGFPVLGLSLYTWSFIVFVCVVAYVALLLFLYDDKVEGAEESLNSFSKFAFAFIALITLANIVTTFMSCGLGPCHD